MAGLNQDLNSNAAYGHSAAAMKKGGATFSGRKPLGDLSNSGKPFLNKPSKKVVTKKNFAFIQEEIDARAKNISKAVERVVSSNRKVLSHISISEKPNRNKLTPLIEEPFHEEVIPIEGFDHNHQECIKAFHEEVIPIEGFDHNHQECIKAQDMTMDMNHFLEALGLANGFSEEVPSLKTPESPLIVCEMMDKELVESFFDQLTKFDDSPPTSPNHDQMQKDIDDWTDPDWIDPIVNFKLADNPKLLKD